jgi:hypothetical protein
VSERLVDAQLVAERLRVAVSVRSRPNVNVEVHIPFLVLEAGDVCLGDDPVATLQGQSLTLLFHRSPRRVTPRSTVPSG